VLPTIAQAAATARARLPAEVWDYYDTGAGDETARAEASTAWSRYRLRPRVLRPVGTRSTATTVLGRQLATPLLVAPAALHGLATSAAEAGTAEGVAGAGSLFVLSTRSSLVPSEATAGAWGATPWWMQLYVMRDRGLTRALIDRAVAAGAEAIVLTVDTPVLGPKRRGLRDVRRPDLLASLQPLLDARAADPVAQAQAQVAGLSDVDALEQDPDLTPEIVEFVREASGLPVVVKGVLRADDACALADAGAAAVYVSNHGGRQADRAVSTAYALPEVVAAVGDRVEVYVDGGIRSGTDALVALALGARAVLLARPVLWALAAAGAAGVQHVLEDLRVDLDRSMALVGAADLSQLTPDLVTPAV
jgi:4-hydroxymandelate oxidase